MPAQIARIRSRISTRTSSERRDGAVQFGFAGNHIVSGAGGIWVIDSTAGSCGLTLRDDVLQRSPTVIAMMTDPWNNSASRHARRIR